MQALFSQLPVGAQEDEAGGEKCKDIRRGHGVQNAHQPERLRQQHHERHGQQNLAEKRQPCRFDRPAHGLHEDKRGLVDRRQRQHAQIHAEGHDSKLIAQPAKKIKGEPAQVFLFFKRELARRFCV